MVVLRRWFLTVACLGLVVAVAAVAALLAWPGVGVAASTSGLAGISLPGFSGHIERVSVRGPDGTPVPVELRGGTVWPLVRLAPGERLTVTVKIRRPSWASWLVGEQEKRTITVITPAAHIRSTLLRPKRGTPVTVSFAEPVSRVVIGGGRLQRLEARPERRASRRPRLGPRDYGNDDSGGRGSVLGDALEARARLVVRSRRPEERRRRAGRR